MLKNTVQAMTLIEFDTSTLDNAYLLAGSLTGALFCIRINNTSNENVTISYDGTHDHEVVLSGKDLTIYTQQGAQGLGRVAKFAIGTPIYVKGATGVGLVYIGGYYQVIQ